MYSWGKATDGQLGLGGIQENIITSPRWNKHVSEKSIRHVACGSKHTLLLTEAGKVHSCGSNEKGQLGQDETSTRPSPIIALESRKIVDVCCGCVHSVALDDQGQLFSWGGNKYGQLGNENDKSEISFVPKVIAAFSNKRVVQVACGANHILALTKDGRLYSWGDNSDGQLGHNRNLSFVSAPTVVRGLDGLPVVKLATGKAHNLVISRGGGVFSWGRNNFGQLGFAPKAGLHGPIEVAQLRKKNVTFVSCGEEHTAVLTQSGAVLTFGSNSYGQLGHNGTQNVSTPTKIAVLNGKEVCQVACGRMHTLVLLKTTCELFSFGLGANGQLGRGTTSNSLEPSLLKSDYWTAPVITGTLLDAQPPEENQVDSADCRVLKGIFAGGDQSFATIISGNLDLPDYEPMDTSTTSSTPPTTPTTPTFPSSSAYPLRDDRIIHLSRLPHYLTGEMVTDWLDRFSGKSNMEKIVQILTVVFTSPSCLNASFLVPDQPTTQERTGVDLDAIEDSFRLIHEKIILPQKTKTNENLIESWIMSNLLPCLHPSPISMECCSLYYFLPLFFGKSPRKHLLLAYVRSFLRLDHDSRLTVGNWFFNGSVEHVKLVMKLIKECVVGNIMVDVKGRAEKLMLCKQPQRGNIEYPKFFNPEEEDEMVAVLELLQLFHYWNKDKFEPVSYKEFHFSHLNKVINFLQDYLNHVKPESLDKLVFCKYPFVLDEDSKSQLLEVECRIHQHLAIVSQGGLLADLMTQERICFVLSVSRNNLINGTLSSLVSAADAELKKPLRVVFADEEGQDDGGIRKEFFMLIFNQILNPDFGMFVEDEESHLIWFREDELFYENVDYYVLIGILCGLAMYNQVLVDLPFPLLLYKKLLGRPTSVAELKEYRPSLGQNLQDMVNYKQEDFEDVYDLTFTVNRVSFGEVSTIDLIPKGSEVKVTRENCRDYVKYYLQYLFHESVKKQFEAFRRGFMKVCNGRVIEMMHPCELQALMVGHRTTDWKKLEENMKYHNGYSKDHPTIKFFWEAFYEFPEETKRKFLVFFTGSDRVPLTGLQSMMMIIQKMDGGPGCAKLPVAHTCFNVLDLPPYTSKEQMKQKLLQAIHFTSGFGII